MTTTPRESVFGNDDDIFHEAAEAPAPEQEVGTENDANQQADASPEKYYKRHPKVVVHAWAALMWLLVLTSPLTLPIWLTPYINHGGWFYYSWFLGQVGLAVYAIYWLTVDIARINWAKTKRTGRGRTPNRWIYKWLLKDGLTRATVPTLFRKKRYKNLPNGYKWAKQTTFGTAGDLSTAAGKFSAGNIAAGERGEKLTAALMDKELAYIPGIRIIHGAQWGETGADYDHIVICGDYAAIVDSKNWAGRMHVQDIDSQVSSILEDDQAVDRKVSIPVAKKNLREKILPEVKKIEVFLAVHTKGEIAEHPKAEVLMGYPEQVIEHIAAKCEKQRGVVNLDDLLKLTSLIPGHLKNEERF